MVSYQFSSSCCAWGLTLLLFRVLAIIFLVSFTGMLVYRFEMSSEAKVKWGRIGVFFSFFKRSVVFQGCECWVAGLPVLFSG